MKIILRKQANRYSFDILTPFNRPVYSSSKQYFLIPFLKSSYQYAWEACRDAWKLAYKHPYHINGLRTAMYDMEDPVRVDISAEEMLTTHYVTVLRNLRVKARGIGSDKEYRKKGYEEVKAVVNELNNIQEKITDLKEKGKIAKILKQYQLLIQKYYSREKQKDLKEMSPIKTASVENNEISNPELIGQVLDTYAEKICQAIQDKHEDAYFGISPNTKEITVYNFSNEPLLKVRINDNLNVDSIIPVGKLYDSYPLHSITFYQKYWKPIVENLGHFCVSSMLIKVDHCTLPDAPKSNQLYTLEGWDCKNKKYGNIDISFQGEKPIWMLNLSKSIKTAQANPSSKYTEQDYINAIVKCIDVNLKSVVGRTGTVIQVIPLEDLVEIDVDFGRGLGIVRLTEKQIQIVPA